ncbi:hypothetical protein [Sphingomonas sp. CROZ-RG-20F-R02-07]|uniref:PGN_0703 family putative restriction endonuclease n=1 Tax=Sphingomonas sp. CROZ-RG-20F-R02-07 TaxID=2914832 RepID=UPI001F58A5F6|nr:hypothetical protein [Sphingomonas sp. CROZ-RG-20F-R02-07]
MVPVHGRPGGQLPIIPVALLKKHHVHEKYDTRFRSCARLLQSLWRERQGLPIGVHRDREGRKRRLGSMLSTQATDTGRNFMNPAVAHLVRREVAYQEAGALIDRQRLYGNLLSSMPLAFNAFAPLAFDKALAAKVMRSLLPDRDIAIVRQVRFEHSPGRRDPALTGDRSAFDVALFYERSDGGPGFVGIEVKYSEGMTEPAPSALNERYEVLAPASGLFKEPLHAALRVNPLQQVFREHLLAQAMLMRGDVAEATFVFLAPRHNHLVQQAASLYTSFLTPCDDTQARFANVHLEQFVDALGWAGAGDEALSLHDRYLDWRQVDQVVEDALLRSGQGWDPIVPASRPLRLIGQAA